MTPAGFRATLWDKKYKQKKPLYTLRLQSQLPNVRYCRITGNFWGRVHLQVCSRDIDQDQLASLDQEFRSQILARYICKTFSKTKKNMLDVRCQFIQNMIMILAVRCQQLDISQVDVSSIRYIYSTGFSLTTNEVVTKQRAGYSISHLNVREIPIFVSI